MCACACACVCSVRSKVEGLVGGAGDITLAYTYTYIYIYLYICIYARSWIVRYGDGEVWRGVGGGAAGWSIVYSVSTRVPAV